MNADLAPDLPTNPLLKFSEEPLASPTAGLDGSEPYRGTEQPLAMPQQAGLAFEILASRERLETKLLDYLTGAK